MTGEAGLPAALAAAIEEAGPALPVRGSCAEQLALLPDGRVTRDAVEALPRGRGRPRGARNRATAAWRDYLGSRYTHPLETLAAIQATPADVLAAQLGCKPVEALAIIKSAAAELAPYMEGKMPVAVDLAVRGDMVLAIEGLTHTRAEMGELREVHFAPGPIVEPEMADFREISGGEAGVSE